MVAARLLNQQHGHPLAAIFGCVTTGDLWRFLKLQDDRLVLDSSEYFIRDVDKILGLSNNYCNSDLVINNVRSGSE